MTPPSSQTLLTLFARKTVVELAQIRTALGGVSSMTVFRHLRKVPYRRSYNHNGRYYTAHELSRYDRHGLWSHGDIHFSRDGSLKKTVRRMVYDAEAGCTHSELLERLRVRCQNTLLGLHREGEIIRERVEWVFVYLHCDPDLGQEQLRRRRQQVERQRFSLEITDMLVIRVLLVLLHHLGAGPADVVRHLMGRAPPVTRPQVDAVFTRYGLGEKGGPRIF